MFNKGIPKVTLCCFLFIHIRASGYTENFQDQTSSRSNTLFDDADDIQRQLDNEARDRIKFGRPKTIWVFHFPSHIPENNSFRGPTESQLERYRRQLINPCEKECENASMAPEPPPPPLQTFREWDYSDQANWAKIYPDCGGKSQSPVDMPTNGLIKARGARKLLFQNFNVQPKSLTLRNDGSRLILFGEWASEKRPLVYGGAAHGRRYLFHSLTLHLPSEHSIGGLIFPMEAQGLFISAEYKDMQHALEASPSDPQAFLAISSLYRYSNHTHKGTKQLLIAGKDIGRQNASFAPKPLGYFNPPIKEYACYQGSMTFPPCTESVLWLVRGRSLTVKRDCIEAALQMLSMESESRHVFTRAVQPLNDRKVFLFR